MKRFADLVLLLPPLLTVGFLIFTFQTGATTTSSAIRLFSTDTPDAQFLVDLTQESEVAAINSSVFLPTPSAVSDTQTPTPTIPPSSTPTQTMTNTPTLTNTPALTNTVTSTVTETPESQEITSGIAKGNEIIQAIESYYLHQGRYPPTLSDLIPAYFSELPATITDQPYFYRFFDPTNPMASELYWLSFRVVEQQNTNCTYLRRLQYWDCNFASP